MENAAIAARRELAHRSPKEDAKRPSRERECLVGERTRIVNRIKSTLARLGAQSDALKSDCYKAVCIHRRRAQALKALLNSDARRQAAKLVIVRFLYTWRAPRTHREATDMG